MISKASAKVFRQDLLQRLLTGRRNGEKRLCVAENAPIGVTRRIESREDADD
jgi:hypothetical protein